MFNLDLEQKLQKLNRQVCCLRKLVNEGAGGFSAGLVAGELYRTGDLLKVVH